MLYTASIVFWFGPYQGIEALRDNAADGAQLYMAVSEDYACRVRHVGAAADPDLRFGAESPDRDRTFLDLAANGCGLYVGKLFPTPAGPPGAPAAAAERAAAALNCLLLDGPEPDGVVSLFSIFYEGEIDEIAEDYLAAVPLQGFPIVIALNSDPYPPDDRNWLVIRTPRIR